MRWSWSLVLVVGLLAWAGCGGGGDREEYAACVERTAGATLAMEELNSRIDVGMNQADYAAEVGDVKVAADQIDGEGMTAGCVDATSYLLSAVELHIEASSAWNNCITSSGCSSSDLAVQEFWGRAGLEWQRAQFELQSLPGGEGVEGEPEDLITQAKVLTAESSLLNYLLEHPFTSPEAAEENLRATVPELSASDEISVDGIEYDAYSITIHSPETGNAFTLSGGLGEDSEYTCTEPGSGECSDSGTWEP